MAELKAALKQAKKLLSEGHSEEALETLQEALDDEIEDYMLFSFAALANANMGDAKQARILYEKAIKLDAKLPAAWQGLYKLFDTGKLPPDDRALEVCNHLIASSDSEEKRHAIEETRRRFYFELNRYDQLEKDPGNDPIFLGKIADKLAKKDVMSTTETALLQKAFEAVKDSFAEIPERNLNYCKFLYTFRDCRDMIEDGLRMCKVSAKITRTRLSHGYGLVSWKSWLRAAQESFTISAPHAKAHRKSNNRTTVNFFCLFLCFLIPQCYLHMLIMPAQYNMQIF
ncbi:tetratricopeptide repeat protein [Oesophagostomum dentatum]|uniref:Tetratricopeptide repeat protein n=1 Tax=Oesophagostomum dentatum TaxID=61180 RepID=A0A0B1SY01_OESDE|nr:tetratricopeptide repeat protein [Oesophagostomum dentatum]